MRHVKRLTPHELSVLEQEFPLDLESTKVQPAAGLGKEAKLYRVRSSKLIPGEAYTGDTYIIDTAAGRTIAYQPHIVDEELKALCKEAARGFVAAAEDIGVLEPEEAGIMHILRAGTGYMVADAMPIHIPILDVRTQYEEEGYRDHSDDPRRLRVSYRSYPKRIEEVKSLVIPDTYATGRSAEAALLDLIAKGFKPETVILYGFIAIPALVRIGGLCEGQGIGLKCFAICDIPQLAHNHYDMPVYGLDESLHAATGETGRLGSIVDAATLEKLIPGYVPGMDQPGDWSERQSHLFNGLKREQGNIRGHLEKSIALIERLTALSRGERWYTGVHEAAAEKELDALRQTLARYV